MHCAGNYGIFHLLQQDLTHPDAATTQSPEDRVAQMGFTPAGLRAWFGATPGWRSFNGAYLVAWGARYMPDVARGRWWLWATSGDDASLTCGTSLMLLPAPFSTLTFV